MVKPVAFGVRDHDGHRQAILITQALDGYFSLDDKELVDRLGIGLRRKIIRAVASSVKRMHKSGWQHGCLYPKHIFVNRGCERSYEVDVRLIDFEKASPLSWWGKDIYRDLDTLYRRSYGWSEQDKLCFLLAYHEGDHEKFRITINKLPGM